MSRCAPERPSLQVAASAGAMLSRGVESKERVSYLIARTTPDARHVAPALGCPVLRLRGFPKVPKRINRAAAASVRRSHLPSRDDRPGVILCLQVPDEFKLRAVVQDGLEPPSSSLLPREGIGTLRLSHLLILDPGELVYVS